MFTWRIWLLAAVIAIALAMAIKATSYSEGLDSGIELRLPNSGLCIMLEARQTQIWAEDQWISVTQKAMTRDGLEIEVSLTHNLSHVNGMTSYHSDRGYLDGGCLLRLVGKEGVMICELNYNDIAGGFSYRELLGDTETLDMRGLAFSQGMAKLLITGSANDARAIVSTSLEEHECVQVGDHSWECEIPWQGAIGHRVLLTRRSADIVICVRRSGPQ